jgi:hypothetical protein
VKTRIVVMRPDEAQRETDVELPGEPTVAELHAVLDPLLGTSNFEHVRVYAAELPWFGEDGYRDMFVDETSALYDLPRNEEATELYRRNWMMHEPDPGQAEDQPAIYGPAVFFPDRVVWF